MKFSIYFYSNGILLGDLVTGLGKVAGVINAISVLLFFGALVMSGLMFASGRTEYLKYGLIGAGIGGLAWVIVQTMFQAASPIDPGIQLQNFR